MFCTKCGKELAEGAKFCNACGTPNALAAAAPVVTPVAPVVETPVAPVAEEPVAPVVETPVVEAPVAAPVQEPVAPVAPVVAPAAPKAAPVAAPAAPAAPKKSKKGLVIFLCILIPLLIAGGVFAWFTIDKNNKTEMLEEANEAIEDGDYEDAAELLEKLGTFEGADQLLAKLNAYIAAQDALLEGNYDQAKELLEQADDFEDAEDILDDLEDNLRDYDKAVKALEKHDFAKAEELLRKLKSFKDSKKLLDSIPFEKAMFLMESAIGDDYQAGLKVLSDEGYYVEYDEEYARRWMLEEAATRFENLLDYKHGDAASGRNQCWFHLGKMYAEQNSLSNAEYYLQMLQENNGGELCDELKAYIDSFYADAKFLDMLKEALEARKNLAEVGDASFSELLAFELEMIEKLTSLNWRDYELEMTFYGYRNAIEEQLYALSNDGLDVEDVSRWYYGFYLRCGHIENLNQKYGFLDDAPELKEIYVGSSNLYFAYYQIEDSLEYYLQERSPYYDYETDRYYLELYNYTDFEYTLQTVCEFYDENGELVAAYEGEVLQIPWYGSVQVWITIPGEDVEWSTWSIHWTYSDISFNGELIG